MIQILARILSQHKVVALWVTAHLGPMQFLQPGLGTPITAQSQRTGPFIWPINNCIFRNRYSNRSADRNNGVLSVTEVGQLYRAHCCQRTRIGLPLPCLHCIQPNRSGQHSSANYLR